MTERSLNVIGTSLVMAFAVGAILNGFSTLAHIYQETDKIPNISGAWALNTELSDDPAKKLAEMREERRGGSGGHMPGGIGGMGGMGGRRRGGDTGGGGRDPEQMQEMRELMTKATEAPRRLTITQAEGTVTFTDGDGRSQTFATNKKKETHQLGDRTVETKTKWDDGRLVRETSLGEGIKLTETHVLVAEPRQLHVNVKLESSRLPSALTLRRVYDNGSAR